MKALVFDYDNRMLIRVSIPEDVDDAIEYVEDQPWFNPYNSSVMLVHDECHVYDVVTDPATGESDINPVPTCVI